MVELLILKLDFDLMNVGSFEKLESKITSDISRSYPLI